MKEAHQPEGDRSEIISEASSIEHTEVSEPTAQPDEPPLTFTEAQHRNPRALLQELHDLGVEFYADELNRNDPKFHLAELALSSAVVWWWNHWQPISIHRALRAGAGLGAVAAAAGTSEAEVYEQWSTWAEQQTRLTIGDRPALTPEEVEAVRERLGFRP